MNSMNEWGVNYCSFTNLLQSHGVHPELAIYLLTYTRVSWVMSKLSAVVHRMQIHSLHIIIYVNNGEIQIKFSI